MSSFKYSEHEKGTSLSDNKKLSSRFFNENPINDINNNPEQGISINPEGGEPTSILSRLNKVQKISRKNKQSESNNIALKIQSTKNFFYLSYGILINSLYGLAIKIMQYTSSPPSFGIIYFISVIQIFFSMLGLKIDNIQGLKSHTFNKIEVDELLIRGFSEFLKNVFIIISLANMRMISTVTIFNLSTVLYTFIFLKQKMDEIKKIDKLSYLFSFIVCLIFIGQYLSPLSSTLNFKDNIKGLIYSMLSLLILCLTALTAQKTCNDFHPYIINFVSGLFGVAISPIGMSVNDIGEFKVYTMELVLFGVIGIFSFYEFYFNQKYIQVNSYSTRSTINYVTIGIAYIFSWLILEEPITATDILASVISILVNYYSKLRLEVSENEDDL